MTTPRDVLEFWFGEPVTDLEGLMAKGQRWGPGLDDEIRERFSDLIEDAIDGRLDHWTETEQGTLALIIVIDQLPRHAYRGQGRQYRGDAKGLALALEAWEAGWPHDLPSVQQTFVLLPLAHTEDVEIQRRSLELSDRIAEGTPKWWGPARNIGPSQARKYLDIIETFGRFPHRNHMLGRENTPEEQAWIDGGGAGPHASRHEEDPRRRLIPSTPVTRSQIDMFGGAPRPLELAELDPRYERWAARLPERVRMGTSSWTFDGWAGLVYAPGATTRAIREHGLGAYARHPLLRAAGVDRTFHAPMTEEQVRDYRRSVPDRFSFLFKAHQDLTFRVFPNVPRFGALAGRQNPRFLDADHAIREVIEPMGLSAEGNEDVLLFQFPPQSIIGGSRGFCDLLDAFLAALPRGPRYAVEIRNSDLFTPRYLATLERHDVLHCINGHPSMPPMTRQFEVTGSGDRAFLLIRWMLSRALDYSSAKLRYSPYDRLIDEDPESRTAVVDMIEACEAPTVLIVNNNAEGCAPESIARIVEALVGDDEHAGDPPG